jgi:hypothetical protein
MVPKAYTDYFTAAAAAAAALIGLLFVSISLRPDSVFAEGAPGEGRALAGSAFTGLVNAFFISLVAVIPAANLGVTAAILACASLYSVLQLHRRLTLRESHVGLLLMSALTYTAQFGVGIALMLAQHDKGFVTGLCYLTVASFLVALLRAWALLQGRHISQPQAAKAAPKA